jgi:hypothetical protein
MRSVGPTILAPFFILCGCASQVELDYEPGYLSELSPSYLAETDIVIIMPDSNASYVYEGQPTSLIGENIALTIPIGAITREIAAFVFQSFFNYGVAFTDQLVDEIRYLVAIEPEIRNFSYRYDRRIEESVIDLSNIEGEVEMIPTSVITPTIQFELALKAYDSTGSVALEKVYSSGPVSGESYLVTSRPHERINATFHAALEEMMLTVAEDIRPLLMDRPDVIDVE